LKNIKRKIIKYNLNIMDMNKYIEVFPNKILLKKPLSQNYYESKLILTNTTEKYVVFKVYINKSSIYSANPSTSYIKPKENITIIIKRLEIVNWLKN